MFKFLVIYDTLSVIQYNWKSFTYILIYKRTICLWNWWDSKRRNKKEKNLYINAFTYIYTVQCEETKNEVSQIYGAVILIQRIRKQSSLLKRRRFQCKRQTPLSESWDCLTIFLRKKKGTITIHNYTTSRSTLSYANGDRVRIRTGKRKSTTSEIHRMSLTASLSLLRHERNRETVPESESLSKPILYFT
jgi:hypothetical protein